MSASLIKIEKLYGIRKNVANNLGFMEDQAIVYLAGNYCVVYYIDTKKQKFLQVSDKHRAISAIHVSSNKRYIGVSEKGDGTEQASIVIYDLTIFKKRKTLHAPEGNVEEFGSLAFTVDSKSLVTLATKPECIITYWAWEKAKVLASLKFSSYDLTKVYCNPFDANHVCCLGSGGLKMYRYSDGSLRAVSGPKSDAEVTCICWLEEDVVAMATGDGRVVISNGTVQEIDVQSLIPGLSSENEQLNKISVQEKESLSITAVLAWKKGFVISTNIGICFVFQQDGSSFRACKIMKIPAQGLETDDWSWQKITNICINISSNLLACTTNRLFVYTCPLSSSSSSRCEELYFELCMDGFHGNEVTGIDVCYKKPIFVTSSLDKHIRIMNYHSGLLELEKEFADESHSVALHPSGLHIVVGFSDKLRFMNIHADDIRTTKEFSVRACKACCFSHGGQYFAVVNGSVINIYSSLTYDIVSNLKGHNAKIKHLIFTQDDLRVFSCGLDGAVYEWEVLTGRRLSENVLKFCSYHGMILEANMKQVTVVGSDNKIKTISDSEVVESVDVGEAGWMVGSASFGMLASPTGSIRTSKRPFTSEWIETYAHSAPINKMVLSTDKQWLISISEDSSLIVWRVQEGREGSETDGIKDAASDGLKETGMRDNYSDDVLITRADIEEKRAIIVELKMRLDEQRLDFDNEMRQRDATYTGKLQQLTEAFLSELEQVKAENNALQDEKNKLELNHEEVTKELCEKNLKELHDLESTNNQKLMIEYEKYQDLESRSQRMQEDGLVAQKEAENRALANQQDLIAKHQLEIAGLQKQIKMLDGEKGKAEEKGEELVTQVEEDADWELLQQRNHYEQLLHNQTDANNKLKNELNSLKKRIISINKDVSDGREEVEHLQVECGKLRNAVNNLEKDIAGYRREIQERDETIQDKERRIFELKKKNQELDKFKFVLDYKNKDLRKQIEPRELDIKSMKTQIQEMDVELKRYRSENQQLELNLDEMRTKLRSQDKEMQAEKAKGRSTELKLDRLLTDVHNCTGHIQDPAILKQQVLALYQKHLQHNLKDDETTDKRREDDWARQREHLERSVATLVSKSRKDAQIHRADNIRSIQDNVSLISEVNELRYELKQARTRLHDLETKLKIAESSVYPAQNQASRAQLPEDAHGELETREREKLMELQRQMEEVKMRPGSNTRLTPLQAV